MRRLLAANAALAALLVVHIADHTARQPADAQLGLVASLPGLLGTVAVFVTLVLVARGWRHAPLVAGAIGLMTGLGFVAVHLAPHWSMFSDPYPDRYLDAASWIQMSACLAAGVWLAYEGRRVTAMQRPAGWNAASGAPRSSAR